MAMSLRRKSTPKGGVGIDVVVTQNDLRDLVRDIGKHGDKKAVRKELTKGLREAVKPMVPKARARVLAQPGGAASTGLRKDMARSVQVKVDLGMRSDRIGVRIRLDGKKLRGRPSSLVTAYEGSKPWRHPVFGSGTWVAQESRGFLTETVNRDRAKVTRDVLDTMTNIGKKLDGKVG